VQILPKSLCRRMNLPMQVPAMALAPRAALVLCQILRFGLRGRGWTERSEIPPGVSSQRSPTPATPKLNPDDAPAKNLTHVIYCQQVSRSHSLEHCVKITHDPYCCDDRARLFMLTKTGRYDE